MLRLTSEGVSLSVLRSARTSGAYSLDSLP
jgi:hypothetical protein